MSRAYMDSIVKRVHDRLDAFVNEKANDNTGEIELKDLRLGLRDLVYAIDNERDEARTAGVIAAEQEFEPTMITIMSLAVQAELDRDNFENVATLAESAAVFLRGIRTPSPSPSYAADRAKRLENVIETFGIGDPKAP